MSKMTNVFKLVGLIGKIATVVFLVIASLMTVATPILIDQATFVNNAFGIQTSEAYEIDSDDPAARNENYQTQYGSIADLREKSHSISHQVQAEGAVLLMNESVGGGKLALPLNAATEPKVSFYGAGAFTPVWGGTGSGKASPTGTAARGRYDSESYPYETSLGTFQKAFKDLGFTVNDTLWDWYAGATQYHRPDSGSVGAQNKIGDAGWTDIATPARDAEADAAIFVLSRIGGEAADRQILDYDRQDSGASTGQSSYLKLTVRERSVLDGLKTLKQQNKVKKIIIIINTSNQVELDWLVDNTYNVDAAIWAGGFGQDGIEAVGELIAGEISPSGKLSVQFWTQHAYNPVQANFGSFRFGTGLMSSADKSNYDHYIAYQEGMYLGYRYAETRYEDFVLGNEVGDFDYSEVVAYPFGYGSSYTTFSYTNFKAVQMPTGSWDLLRARREGGKADGKILDAYGEEAEQGTYVEKSTKTPYMITFTITNTGSKPAKEAAQVYLQRPYTAYDRENHIEKPSVDLVGFHKTETLGAGESEDVTIYVDEKYFAAFDSYGAGTYVVTPGDYYLTAAANAHEAVNNILRHKNANDKIKYPNLNPSKIDATFGQGGEAALAAKFTNPCGATVNTEKYAYSDVTGLEINNLFDSVDPNRDPLARGTSNPTDNMVAYVSRSDWSGTVKLLDTSKAIGQQTCQVIMAKSSGWQPLMEGRSQSNNPPNKAPTADNPMPEMQPNGTAGTITLAMMTPIPDANGNLVHQYAYDDPKWDEFLNQLTPQDYENLTSDGFRSTAASDTVAKPRTMEHNGPNGFIYRYATYTNAGVGLDASGDGKRGSEVTVMPFANIGVTQVGTGDDAWYRPNRVIPGTSQAPLNPTGGEPMYEGQDYIYDPDAGMYPTAFPSNILVAATYNRELAEKVGEMIGEDALWGGYSGIYGTGVNIIRSPHQGRAFEYYSEDGFLSGVIAGRWSRGVQSKGCYVYNKHFALNEQELSRETIATFVNEQTFREIYLRAFEIPIAGEIVTSIDGMLGTEEYDAKCLMGAFNRVGVEYSVTSQALFTDWLRGEAHLSGFTVSDYWQGSREYMNIGWALLGGNALPDGNTTYTNTAKFLEGGANENVDVVWRMRESIKRIMYTVADSNAMGGYSQNTRIRELPVAWPDMLQALTTTSWVLFGLSSVAFVGSAVVITLIKLKETMNK